LKVAALLAIAAIKLTRT